MTNQYDRIPSEDFGRHTGLGKDLGIDGAPPDRLGFHWVIQRSALLDRFCDCVKETPKSYAGASKTCRSCLGTGRLFVDYFVKATQYIQTRQFAADEPQTPFGKLSNSVIRYAIWSSDLPRPSVEDLIIEIVLDKKTAQPLIPLRIIEVYNVMNVRTLRKEGGAEAFYSLVAERRQILPGTFSNTNKDFI